MKGLLIVLEQLNSDGKFKVLGLLREMSPGKVEESLHKLAGMDAEASINMHMVLDALGAPLTTAGVDQRMTPEEREIFEDLRSG